MDEMHVNEDEVELIHPDIVANIPGIELVSDFEDLGGATEEPVRDVINFTDRTAAARQAARLNNKQLRSLVGKTIEDTIVEDVEFDDKDDEDFDNNQDKAL